MINRSRWAARGARHVALRWFVIVFVGTSVSASPTLASAQRNPLRDVFFGETHIHTSWSFDAYVFGNTLTGPEDAYQFALGEPIRHPAGYMVQMKSARFRGGNGSRGIHGHDPLANDPQSDLSKLPIARQLTVKSKEDIQKIYLFLGATIIKNEPDQELVSPEVAGSVRSASSTSQTSTTSRAVHDLAGYEWTSTPDNRNLHRNVIFKD
jgi:hypothetical protein